MIKRINLIMIDRVKKLSTQNQISISSSRRKRCERSKGTVKKLGSTLRTSNQRHINSHLRKEGKQKNEEGN